jgi:hypothetical protein
MGKSQYSGLIVLPKDTRVYTRSAVRPASIKKSTGMIPGGWKQPSIGAAKNNIEPAKKMTVRG